MAKYRKKPVEIEARQLTRDNGSAVASWCGGRTTNESGDGSCDINIQTLEGVMTARVGDYVIQGVQGEFYPCKPDIFEAAYEPVQS